MSTDLNKQVATQLIELASNLLSSPKVIELSELEITYVLTCLDLLAEHRYGFKDTLLYTKLQGVLNG